MEKPNLDQPVTQRFLSVLSHFVWIPLLIYYAIGILGAIYEPFHWRSLEIMNSGPAMRTSETVLIEHLEAAFWLIAFSVFTATLIKRKNRKTGAAWLIVFMLVCFAALGEETSWGQHYLGYSTPETLNKLNAQEEFNVHNLHIGKTLNLPENNILHQLGTATTYLNYTFYSLCILIWLVIPVSLNSSRYFRNTNFLRNYPRQSVPILIIYSLSVAIFLFVDFLIFDAGELFELTQATAGCATAFGCMKLMNFQT